MIGSLLTASVHVTGPPFLWNLPSATAAHPDRWAAVFGGVCQALSQNTKIIGHRWGTDEHRSSVEFHPRLQLDHRHHRAAAVQPDADVAGGFPFAGANPIAADADMPHDE